MFYFVYGVEYGLKEAYKYTCWVADAIWIISHIPQIQADGDIPGSILLQGQIYLRPDLEADKLYFIEYGFCQWGLWEIFLIVFDAQRE